MVTNEIDAVIKEEVELIATGEIETAMQYFSPVSCECSSKIKNLEKELAESKDQIISMTKEIITMTKQIEKQIPDPFCEESLVSDEVTKFYTGLPNVIIVKAVFEHVSKTLPSDGITKLSPFQEFMCVLLKLRLNCPIKDLAFRFGVYCVQDFFKMVGYKDA